MTFALQVCWLLFVVAHWATGASSGEWALALSSLSYGYPLGVFAAITFSLTPIVTIPALIRKTRRLLIPALACNLVSLVYGIVTFIAEGDLNNAMVVLAVAMPLVTITASAVSLRSVARILRALPTPERG